MYIVRWLIGHPIVAIWVLLGTTILLAIGAGAKGDAVESGKTASAVPSDLIKIETINNSENMNGLAEEPTHGVDRKMEVKAVEVKASLKPAPNNLEVEAELDSKGAATTDLSQITNEEMLLMAREAYWNNGLDEAAQIYTRLIENEPAVFEHKGELGNVLWRQGFPQKAAKLYSEIAIPMIESGGSERVANMIGFIGLFYPDRAAAIHEKMQSMKQEKLQ